MIEQLREQTTLDPSIRILALRNWVNNHTFSGAPEKRPNYESRGLVYTNNLPLFFTQNPVVENGSDVPNRYDYRQREFAHVFEQFIVEQPELWQQAIDAHSITPKDDMEDSYDALFATSDPAALLALQQSANWEKEAVFTQVFDVLAPMLVDAGFDPLLVCV